ncbi:MAG: CRISPR-associated endonuclease Cas1 [Oceanospirillaceae bacterium]|nr:CRISPR-associated endonuclease Cas1 [Oceanospirillaceae bacterium]
MGSKQLIFDRRHIELDYDNQCLVIREPPHGVRTLPLRYIRKIVCVHGVTLSSNLLGQLWQRGIDFIALNPRDSERSFGLYPDQQQQVQRRCQQYQWQQDNEHSLSIARTLCRHRLQQQLRYLAQQPTDTRPDELIQQLSSLQAQMTNATHTDTLRGLEGTAQRLMFQYWRRCLPSRLGFEKRQRRPPPDPVNALLSLTYTIAMQEAIRQCKAAGLDSQLGFYHRVTHGRHALACDLMEVARPQCEQWVVELFNTGAIKQRHFSGPTQRAQGCRLGKAGRTLYYQHLASVIPKWQTQLAAAARWLARQVDQRAHHAPMDITQEAANA